MKLILKILDSLFSKQLLYLIAIAGIVIIIIGLGRMKGLRNEKNRLENNQNVLLEQNKYYKAKDSSYVAITRELRLTKKELKDTYEKQLKNIENKLGIALKKIESITNISSSTTNEFYVHVKDSIINDTQLVKVDFYQDEWLTYERILPVGTDLAHISYQSRDSLIAITNWYREGFFLFRWLKPKIYQQTINSMNPNSVITYAEYIKVSKKRKRR